MAKLRRFELEDVLARPGTYYNPTLDVLVVVDDSAAVDNEIFEGDEEGSDEEWVLVSEEVPVDEAARDDLLERFQARHAETTTGVLDDEDDDEVDELEPDPDPDEV
jgi:hypothetical protein